MKLGEAKTRLEQVERWLAVNLAGVQTCPIQNVVKLLEESNDLLQKKKALQKRILQTEEVTLLEGSTLYDIIAVLELLDKKITIMERLSVRTDLDLPQQFSLHEQLKGFRASRDALELNVDQCLWNTELLDE